MKRGRPSLRHYIINYILECLSQTQTPVNVSYIKKYVDSKMERNVSWNTIKKYLNELMLLDKVKKIKLPHSKEKDKEGLTLYTLR
ncbi:MAG: hypothetical protein J7K83_01805 [Candidatus Aenigmarchaeota archaeon]|nr:hypothetical protein [Candidatus Aenigmarchaeota archaeon]